jgi:hypothetical protein
MNNRGRPPKGAISVRKSLPREHVNVLGFASDAIVALHYLPVVVWRDSTNQWWSGLPQNYFNLNEHRWKVTHWIPIPENSHGR